MSKRTKHRRARAPRLLAALALLCACGEEDALSGAGAGSGAGEPTDGASAGSGAPGDTDPGDPSSDGGSSGGGQSSGGGSGQGSGGGQGTGDDATGDPDPVKPEGPVFEDVTDELGLEALHKFGNAKFIPTGQAWFDIDGDALLELVVTHPTAANTLMHNLGGGLLAPMPGFDALALPDHASGGVAPADYDNDGWTDALIGGDLAPNILLRNKGGATFDDVTASAGLGDEGPGTTASWGDYDGDGWLDLYVPNNNHADPDRLYRNRGDGSFEDVSALLPEEPRLRLGLAAAFFDFDDDGDLDLYVLNDKYGGNLLWRNDGPGCGGWCFADVSAETGAGVEMFAMGVAIGDYDLDGDLDLFLTNIGEHVLLQSQLSQGSASYVDVAAEAGVLVDDLGWGEVGWGCTFLDYDRDGWLDLYVVIGNYANNPSLGNRLYRNRGDGGFEDVSEGSGAELLGVGFGLASADFDGDGRRDLTVGMVGEGYRILRNRGAHDQGHNWLGVELRGAGPVNRDAIGARVVVTTSEGLELRRDLISGATWGGGRPRRQHFGLGAGTVESLEITWPDGLVEQLAEVEHGQLLVREYPAP